MGENAERFRNYYGMSKIIHNLYSNNTGRYNNLFRLVVKEQNIKLAIKKLSYNGGSNTPGPDGITFEDVKKEDFNIVLAEVRKRLHLKVKPKGREVKIPKQNGGYRTLGITNIYDRIAQQCILNILDPICESRFCKSSFGFRPNLKAQHCIATFNNSMWRTLCNGREYHIIDADLTKCFDTIQLDKVLDSLRVEFQITDTYFLQCIKGLMSIRYGKRAYNGVGLAQGSILGPTLCNCLLHKLDKKMYEISDGHKDFNNLSSHGRMILRRDGYERFRKKFGNCFQLRYVRYADDFLIGCGYKEDIPLVMDIVKGVLEEIGVALNEEKTTIKVLHRYGNESIDFLGYKIKATNGHIRISPKDFSKTTSIIRKKVRQSLLNLHFSESPKIHGTTSILSGYINYYDICTNLKPLIEYCIQVLYWTGYKRLGVLDREPNRCIYYTKKRTTRGRRATIDLYDIRRATNRSYKEYIKVPYWVPGTDTEFQWINNMENFKESFKNIYLHGLLIRNPEDVVTGETFNGLIPVEIHHKIPLKHGGTDSFGNLLPVTPYTHRLIHCPKEEFNVIYNPDRPVNLRKLNQLRKLAKNDKI